MRINIPTILLYEAFSLRIYKVKRKCPFKTNRWSTIAWRTTRLVFEAHISHSDRRDCFLGHRSVSNGEGSRNEGQGTGKGTDGEVERWSERKWDTSVRSVRRERPFRVKWRKVRWSGSWKESLRPCYPPETVALAARRKFFQHCERGGRLACSFLSLTAALRHLETHIFEINWMVG